MDIELNFNKDNAFNHVENQLSFGYRIPGTQASRDCVNYFISKFQEIGSDFSYYYHNYTISHGESANCQNVLFKLNTNLSDIVILASHYDSRAKATKDSKNPTSPVPGANDGASGSAVLVELANALYSRKESLECQIWFLFIDAEDQGHDIAYGMDGWDWCEGSWKFIDVIDDYHHSNNESIDCMILLDMVGGKNLQFLNELHSTSSLLEELFVIGQELGFTNQFPVVPYSTSITDDHQAFLSIDIPSADLIINFWNNPDWPYHHTTDDDLSHISRDSLEVTGKTVEQFIYNNYHMESNYKGNYPWSEDIDVLPTDIVIILLSSLAIISIVVIIIYSIHRNNLKKKK